MNQQNDPDREDRRNKDPLTGEPGSHPVGVGVGTTGGAVAGAAVGAVGGPVGAVIGSVVGGIAGAAAGKSLAEGINPTEEDAYWREHHASQQWADRNYTYDDYSPAYRMGYEGPGRYHRTWEDAEPDLQTDWDAYRGDSRLTWEEAREAARASWHRVERAVPGDADADGR